MITEDIIKEAQAGNSEAFATIYNETVRTAYYVAKRILLDEDATEDVLQEAYIAVFEHLSDYKAGNIQGWIDTIVANRAKNYLRRKNPIFFSEMETEENPVVEFEEEKIEFRPDEKVDYNETQRLVLEIVDNLSPEQRISVMLFYFEEKSVKEIAEICECSENTVKSRLNYARKKIKEDVLELEKKGTKLYSVSIIPFIIWMLSQKAKTCEVPKVTVGKVLSGVNAATNTVSNAAVSTAGNAAMNSAVNVAAGTTAKSVAAKVGMTLAVKIAIGVAAVAVTVGAVIGGVAIKNSISSKNNNEKGEIATDKYNDNIADDELDDDYVEDVIDIPCGGNYLHIYDADNQSVGFINGSGAITLEDQVREVINKGYYLTEPWDNSALKHIDGRIIVEPGTYEVMRWLDSCNMYDNPDEEIFYDILEVKKDNKWGVINTKGEIIVDLEYDSIKGFKTCMLDEQHYVIVAEKTNENGEIVSTAFKHNGKKLLETTGETIEGRNFVENLHVYIRKDESGKCISVISVKTGEVLIDCIKEGIKELYYVDNHTSTALCEDDTWINYAFDEDYSTCIKLRDELNSHCHVLLTDKIYGFYSRMKQEIDFYVDETLEKTINDVETAWVWDNEIYYIVEDSTTGNRISLCNQDGVILSADEYTWYYSESETKRYIVVKSNNETTYQLYDLAKKEVIVRGITSPETVDSGIQHFTWQLEDGSRVTAWRENKIAFHGGDMIVKYIGKDYMFFSTKEGENHAITDMDGNVTFEFVAENNYVYHHHKIVYNENGGVGKYYNFNGNLLCEVSRNVTTDEEEEIVFASTREECIAGINQAAEALEQGQQVIVRCDNPEVTIDISKSISVLYRWLLEEDLFYNVYCMYDNNEYVDFYVSTSPYKYHVIPVKNLKDAPAKAKEYIEGLDDPTEARFEIWTLQSEFSSSDETGETIEEQIETYLSDQMDYIEYAVSVSCQYYISNGSAVEYEGIEKIGCYVMNTKRVYSVEELAEYIKEKKAESSYPYLFVYLYLDDINENNYIDIISDMAEKEGFSEIHEHSVKYIRDGVLYLPY